jgi:hypothetical protein
MTGDDVWVKITAVKFSADALESVGGGGTNDDANDDDDDADCFEKVSQPFVRRSDVEERDADARHVGQLTPDFINFYTRVI